MSRRFFQLFDFLIHELDDPGNLDEHPDRHASDRIVSIVDLRGHQIKQNSKIKSFLPSDDLVCHSCDSDDPEFSLRRLAVEIDGIRDLDATLIDELNDIADSEVRHLDLQNA